MEKTRQEKQFSRLNFHEEFERKRLGVIVDDKILEYGCHVHWLVVGHIVDSSVLVRRVGQRYLSLRRPVQSLATELVKLKS
jgi:hypothetical protein